MPIASQAPPEQWQPDPHLDPGKPYRARSASDKTDDWPFWYVSGEGDSRNVLTLPQGHEHKGAVMTSREIAEAVAKLWNLQ